MKITVLASGSKGNCTIIETKNKKIMIDAGLSLATIESRYEKKLTELDALIITHTHSDHIKGINSIVKKLTPTIYTIDNSLRENVKYENIINTTEMKIGEISIELFELSHDVTCAGVYIKSKEKEIVYITDTGYVKQKILNKYKNKTVYILESNYEEELLKNSKYPFYLQQRIRSDKGHISNEDSCRYLKKVIGSNTKYIMSAHLSEENNNPERVAEGIIQLLNEIDFNPNHIICKQNEKRVIEV